MIIEAVPATAGSVRWWRPADSEEVSMLRGWLNTAPRIVGWYAFWLAVIFLLFSLDDDGTSWWLYAWFALCAVGGATYQCVQLARSKQDLQVGPER